MIGTKIMLQRLRARCMPQDDFSVDSPAFFSRFTPPFTPVLD